MIVVGLRIRDTEAGDTRHVQPLHLGPRSKTLEKFCAVVVEVGEGQGGCVLAFGVPAYKPPESGG